ncbi:MAG: CPBP family intramembrane metalloprotease [Sedimentisphaerales bacterium]|nr:CPBP family intramembrane metalloprotease [Sedimentisphaerales bacterium]
MERLNVPLFVVLAIHLLLGVVIFAILIFIGLYLGEPLGLGAPYISNWLKRKRNFDVSFTLWLSIVMGILTGAIVFALDRYIFVLKIYPVTVAQDTVPLWTRISISIYDGIGEELAWRLGFMTLLVWITWKIKATPENKPTRTGIWIAIMLASVIFALGHLPLTARWMEITSLVVIRALILNGLAGIVFGWLYWQRGLEAAMIAHFTTDIIIHVALPLAF